MGKQGIPLLWFGGILIIVNLKTMSNGYKIWADRSLKVSPKPDVDWFRGRGRFSDVAILINVSDEYNFYDMHMIQASGVKTYWFPMNECKKDIGLNSLYGAMCVLYSAEECCDEVVVHCAAGTNRSPLVVEAYHYMRTGEHALEDIDGGRWRNQLERACSRGYLPPLRELEQFLTQVGQKLRKDGHLVGGGSLDKIKRNTIFNF